MRLTKKRLIGLLACSVLILLVSFEMRVWAPSRLSFHFETVTSSKIPESFDDTSIAVISDTLSNLQNLKRASATIFEYSPDMILFAGNTLDPSIEVDTNQFMQILKELNAPLGKYAILNKDEADTTRMMLQTAGFTILNNQALQIFSPSGESINLVGFNDNITVVTDESFTLGLTHDPALIPKLDALKLDAIVAGKTHLGHVNIPLVGSLIHENQFTRRRSIINNFDVILTSGIGTNSPKVRLLSHPDVLILNLNKK